MLEDEPLAHVWIGVSMLNLSRRAVLTGGALLGTVAIAVPTLAAPGDGGGVPANKAVAAGSSMMPVTTDGPKTLLTATLKTSKPTDLLMSVSLECALLTSLVTENGTPSSTAHASVRAWLEITGDGVTRVVPIESGSTPPQNGSTPNSGDQLKDAVTFCERDYGRTVTDGENDLASNAIDKQDDYINTKSSHAFNWVLLNAGSGLRTVSLKAVVASSESGKGKAEALVGNRTMIIEPTKMANNAVIAENGTSNSGS